MTKKIGILTAGGDSPGLNAAIRGVAKTSILEYGWEVFGFIDGFKGLINEQYISLNERSVSGIMTVGGTILGTSREKPFKNKPHEFNINKPKRIIETYEKLNLDCIVCLGGNGTQKTAHKLAEIGLNVIGLPKTIDNDVWGTDQTFGFDSAVNICTDAIDRLHSTGNSHKRIMVIEIMGHNAGWLTLYSGIAGGGDVILLPEIPYDEQVIADYLLSRSKVGKPYSIVVVAEGIDKPKKKGAGSFIAQRIEELTGIETRETVLGYIQRGGTPSPMDRVLATRYGGHAADLINQEKYGYMVCLRDDKISEIPLSDVAGKLKLVDPKMNLIKKAKRLGVCFGDELTNL